MISYNQMKAYLTKSLSSFNENKSRGLLAEHKLIQELKNLEFSERIAPGGWIVRNTINEDQEILDYAHHTCVLFPDIIIPDNLILNGNVTPPLGLHTICATMHQLGINSYYCIPNVVETDQTTILGINFNIDWKLKQLGIPTDSHILNLSDAFPNFAKRSRKYNFLRYNCDVSLFPTDCIISEFTKENLRVNFQTMYMCEISDIDGIFWGNKLTYPLEIKEKSVADDPKIGQYFGIDAGPFVKLAYYASKSRNMHSLFFVREVNEQRQFLNWWFISFEVMAQFASWIPIAGGKGMGGGQSHVIKIPKAEFLPMTQENLSNL